MSSERKRKAELSLETVSDTDITDYLKTHPDFFERHPGLVAHINLPHDAGTNTVSLIERQVAILREKNRKLDQKLRELVGVARANDALAHKIHKLSLDLIATRSLPDALVEIERVFRTELGGERSVLVLFGKEEPSADLFDTDFVRRMPRNQPGLELFQSFLNTGRPRCGQVKGAKREFLFGDGSDIKSAALIPLGNKAETGFAAIGSNEATRFHPGMSTDFLARLGELVDRGLSAVS